MSKSDKVFYGVSAFLPIVFIVGFLISIIGPLQALLETAAWNSGNPRNVLPYLPDLFASAFTMAILMLITTLALLIAFTLHAVKNKSLSDGERIIWIALFFLVGTFAFPIYFFARIWNSGNESLLAVAREI